MPTSASASLGGAQAQPVDLGLALLVRLLDALRMDPPVEDQPLEREPADLAADRVETGQQHRLRRVVDDQVDAGDRLVGADVAALAADDPALHLVAGQVHDADDGLAGLVAGHPLDRLGDDGAGPFVGLRARLGLDVADEDGGIAAGGGLDAGSSSALACSAVSPATRSSSRTCSSALASRASARVSSSAKRASISALRRASSPSARSNSVRAGSQLAEVAVEFGALAVQPALLVREPCARLVQLALAGLEIVALAAQFGGRRRDILLGRAPGGSQDLLGFGLRARADARASPRPPSGPPPARRDGWHQPRLPRPGAARPPRPCRLSLRRHAGRPRSSGGRQPAPRAGRGRTRTPTAAYRTPII